mmetsp:Transcript_42760/g.93320  ORF Transcript_42760/g.93320 Transcript_42760/m.93320 type:complete len:100 (+) Transcript_42760:272-571(+)
MFLSTTKELLHIAGVGGPRLSLCVMVLTMHLTRRLVTMLRRWSSKSSTVEAPRASRSSLAQNIVVVRQQMGDSILEHRCSDHGLLIQSFDDKVTGIVAF